MATALLLALALATTDAPPPTAPGEPLPPGAPQDEYLLAGWCYGALAEYLEIYDTVKPDLADMDRMFGTSVKEEEPYHADVAASRSELKVIAGAITAAERASPQPIAPQGALAIRAGQAIWQQAEGRTRRELARAWMSWGLPDRCDTNARSLTAKANVLGRALTYNNGASAPPPPAGAATSAGDGALILAPIAPVSQHFAASPTPARPVAMTASPTPAAASEPPPPAATENAAAEPATEPPAPPPPAAAETVTAAPSRVLDEGSPPPVSAGGTVSAAAEPPPAAAPPPVSPPAAAPPPAVAAAPKPQPPQTDQSSEPVL